MHGLHGSGWWVPVFRRYLKSAIKSSHVTHLCVLCVLAYAIVLLISSVICSHKHCDCIWSVFVICDQLMKCYKYISLWSSCTQHCSLIFCCKPQLNNTNRKDGNCRLWSGSTTESFGKWKAESKRAIEHPRANPFAAWRRVKRYGAGHYAVKIYTLV